MEHNPRKLVGMIIGFVLFAFIIIFGFNRFSRYLGGPQIISINLEEYSVIQENPIIITGSLANTSVLTINGVNTSINDDLSFRKIIVIPTGNSIIEIGINDTFNNYRQYQYYVNYGGEDRDFPSARVEAVNKQIKAEAEEALQNEKEQALRE